MLIGGNFYALSGGIYGISYSWIAKNPKNFIVQEKSLEFLPEICKENVLIDNFLMEIPFVWEDGVPKFINYFADTSIFFFPEGKIDIERVVSLLRVKTKNLGVMSSSQLKEDVRVSILSLIRITESIKTLKKSVFLADLKVAAYSLGLAEFAAHVTDDNRKMLP